jgi:predicted metal-binding protein
MVPQRLKKVKLNVSEEEIKRDLARYCDLAKEHGATEACTIKTDQVHVDERVILKCRIPKCFGYGTSAHCPPHSLKPEETREILTKYQWAVAVRLDVDPEVIVRDKSTILERVEAYRNIFKVVNIIESAAFYDGHYLSVGLGAGSCKSTFCHDKDCTVLKGEKCRLALRARPSMEAVGIDCYRLATELNWVIYPIGSDAEAGCVPQGMLMGLVLVD